MIDDITKEDVPTESHNEKKILERCIALMGAMVDDCETWIKWRFGEDCLEKIPEDERLSISYSYFEIVQQLFLWTTTHSGGTSTRAKCKELGVKPSERITFEFEDLNE